jgi:hypothetical protein
MKRKGDHSTVLEKGAFWLRVVLNCCLVAFYTLFVLSEPGGGLRNTALGHVHRGLSSQILHATFITVDHHSSHPSARSRAATVVSEVTDSSETESGGSESTKLSDHLLQEISSNLHSGKSIFLQLKHAHEILARISLVVLHHCWKSYLP